MVFQTGPKIAIAEVDGALAFMMAETFNAAGYNVVGCARNARDTLKLIDREPIDFLVLEFDLDGARNGLELIVEAKLRNPDIKTILVTGWNINDIALRTGEIHPDGILRKPFMPRHLIAAVHAARYAAYSGAVRSGPHRRATALADAARPTGAALVS
tara:strand:- start:91 stop:561 length:471 start_codon:yes stop_codon:yes gene_type:complete